MARPQTFDVRDLATAGLAVAERDGWSAVSVRAVADRLGVTPMALYRLAPDAGQLRRLIADAAAAKLQPGSDASDLLDTMSGWARRAYRSLARHRGLSTYLLAEWTELPQWLDIVETFLTHAESEGIVGDRAVATLNAVCAFVLVRAQVRDNALAAPRRALAPVRHDRGRYPLISRNITEFTVARSDKHFAIGLDVLIAGLREDVAAGI